MIEPYLDRCGHAAEHRALRFARLGAAANIQPLWTTHEPRLDELTIPFLGERGAGRQYLVAALLRAGAILAAGSDWPVSSPDPIQGITSR